MIRYIVVLFLISHVSRSKFLNLPRGSRCSWQGIQGTCVEAHRCLSAVNDIENNTHTTTTNISYKIYVYNPPLCSFEGNIAILCCTDCELVPDTRLMLFDPRLGILTKSGTSKAKDKCLEFIHQLDYPCKSLYEPKDFVKKLDPVKKCTYLEQVKLFIQARPGGVNAKRSEFPHMALLGYGNEFKTAEWMCGGTVISEKFILTAAHCLYSVNLGSVKYIALGILKRSDPVEIWQVYNVHRVFRYPTYNPPSKYHDIALLETDRTIFFNPSVRPACLHVDDKPDSYAFATGWGVLGQNQGLADVLQSIMLHRFEAEECSDNYPPHRHLVAGFHNYTQMCYGDRMDKPVPPDTCEGDSGGPLQSLQHENCVFTILGVTSYGRKCGVSGGSGIYTRVRSYVSWIEYIVWP